MTAYRCLHTKSFTVTLINCQLEEILEPLENTPVGLPQAKKTIIKCGIAIFSAGLSAPMSLYDFDTEEYVGRMEIPDEVKGTMIPQSFCDPDDQLELDLVRE